VHQAWVDAHRSPGPGPRPRTSKYFASPDEFTKVVCSLIRLCRRKGREPTQKDVARLLMQTQQFNTENIDSAIRMLGRYAKNYGYTWQRLLDLCREA
jgi:hypothetical protein